MANTQEIVFYHRYEKKLHTEAIYGEKPLRWAYSTLLGKLCLEGAFKRPWFSRLYGKWADNPASAREIPPFLERFGLDSSEFLERPESFRSFNDFFSRKLRPGARPIAEGENTAVFPADGRHLWVPDLSTDSHLYAKGQKLSLTRLLGDGELAERFAGGTALLSRLCPTDYHRFHFPLAGVCGAPKLIKGHLYSVNPIALSLSLHYLWENKRRVTVVENPALGSYLFLEIGATNVGSIVDTATPGDRVKKGDEKGYFRFGGSMVIVLFPPNTFTPDPDLREQSMAGVELYAKMGDHMGMLHG